MIDAARADGKNESSILFAPEAIENASELVRNKKSQHGRSRFQYGSTRSFGQQMPKPRNEPIAFRVARELLHGRFDLHDPADPSAYRQMLDCPEFYFF